MTLASRLLISVLGLVWSTSILAHGGHPEPAGSFASLWHIVLHLPAGLFALALFLVLIVWLGGSLRRDP